jgi:hypothetical protein
MYVSLKTKRRWCLAAVVKQNTRERQTLECLQPFPLLGDKENKMLNQIASQWMNAQSESLELMADRYEELQQLELELEGDFESYPWDEVEQWRGEVA